MGASGAGKTTLLDVLALRKDEGVVEGDIKVDGRPLGKSFKRTTGYVSVGHAATDSIVKTDQINLAQNFVAVGSDSANRFTMGIMHMF